MSKYVWPESPGFSAFPIARPGYGFIALAAFTTAILAIVGLKAAAVAGLGITIFICYFFRDPDRVIPADPASLVSPADGKVVIVEKDADNPYAPGKYLKICVFMNVFNVHVNRIPFDGEVFGIQYFPGKFFNASFDKASTDNERNAITVTMPDGRLYTTVQIAGLVARRIVCGLKTGDSVSRGRRFGMICFGSRLDVYLPNDSEAAVAVGDRVSAGLSVLARLDGVS